MDWDAWTIHGGISVASGRRGRQDGTYRSQEIGDIAFYRDLAIAANGPVLEVGCGTGRVYLELLQAGVDADGIDLSSAVLDVLERKAAKRELEPSVWRADMREFAAERDDELILTPFRSFLHNVTVEDQLTSLEALRAAFRPGGRLSFNVFVPSFDVICNTYGKPTSEPSIGREMRTEFSTRPRSWTKSNSSPKSLDESNGKGRCSPRDRFGSR